jgi:hypothetical protein
MHPKIHGTPPRGLTPPPLSPLHEGRFGRMFRKLAPMPALDEDRLRTLAESMREPDAPSGGGWAGPTAPPEDLDNPDIPAGYTYFGQFIDHDITFDPISSLDQENDPDALQNFRTPRFDLDSIYGSGPADEPFQYDRANPGKLLIGSSNGQPDLPRNSENIALIGDPRNDENIIVSGIHTAFLLLHNKLFDEVAQDPTIPQEHRFEETQRRVRWHYQWIIVKDFLRRLVGADLLNELFRETNNGTIDFTLPNYRPRKNAFMPVEFSVAAYRFGHSQVRPVYNLNGEITNLPIFAPGDHVGDGDLRGRKPLPAGWKIDWRLFLSIDGSTPQPSRKIDTRLAAGLFDLPDRPATERQSLAELNLVKGESFGLPSGQDVAKYLGLTPRSGDELGGAPDPTPLWYYILKESEIQPKDPNDPASGGRQLGPVGSLIVAEVLLGLVRADPKSWVNIDPQWQPTIPAASADGFQLGDLVKYATS